VKLVNKILFLYIFSISIYANNISNIEKELLLGNRYIYQHKYKKAESIYKNILETNASYTPALNNLGMLYFFGKGVDKNLTKAVLYLGKSAMQDDKNAQFYLALSLSQIDQKIFKDEILYWIRKSASNGYTKAQVILGLAFIKGDDINKDMKKAKYWIHKAMESNSSEASTIWDKYQLWRY
jgi:hypothetical protein